jgi:hypothetical protein
MRLGIKLISNDSTLNRISYRTTVSMVRGETFDLIVQLVDLEQNGLRYIPAAGAVVKFQIPRRPETLATSVGREIKDYTIDRPAAVAFPGDNSIYKISLTAEESANMVSNGLRVIVEEGVSKKIATLLSAIKVDDWNEV